jgi:methanogenic corrinoid protein MtbC1
VGVSVTTPGYDEVVRKALGAIREVVDPTVAVLVGGRAVHDDDHARALGADGWAADARAAVGVLDRLAERTAGH